MKSSFLFAIMTALALVGCKSTVSTEYAQRGLASLRLFEESSGSLFDLKNGNYQLEVDAASILPGSKEIALRLRSEGHSYLFRVSKSKIAADGTFDMNETELEQPVRLVGKIQQNVEVKVYKGFSSDAEPIGEFTTKLDNENLKLGVLMVSATPL